jgi:hypothetical protein
MEIFKIAVSKKPEMEKILAMDQIFRLSITIRDSSIFGEDGYLYLILEGLESRLKIAKEELSKISEPIDKGKFEKIREYIENERDRVNDSFGSIFG